MRKFVASLLLITASAFAAFAQPPAQRPAAPADPPRPVLGGEITDARLRSLFEAAREAGMAMRYDEAVRLSDEGIAAVPNHPSFWLVRAEALYSRGVATYNRFYRSKDEAEKKTGVEAAGRDFRDAVNAATRGLALLDEYKAPDDEATRASLAAGRRAGLWIRAQALAAVALRFDESYSADALTAFEQYAAAEADPEMGARAHFFMGQLRLATKDFAGAAIQFRKVADADPSNADALLGEAVSLIDQGHLAGDPSKLREGFERLRAFVEKAPGHHARASAAQAVEYYNRPAPPKEEAPAVGDGPAVMVPRPVEGGVINGRAISKPAPPYPAVAKVARADGTVAVHLVVDERGDVISADASAGHPLLRAVAVEAARQAKFTPTTLSGRPVKVSGVITYNFVLQ